MLGFELFLEMLDDAIFGRIAPVKNDELGAMIARVVLVPEAEPHGDERPDDDERRRRCEQPANCAADHLYCCSCRWLKIILRIAITDRSGRRRFRRWDT